ncbi:hypothetical protein DENSPDRAFT_845547 [Dentipellis sp. KUC8613]|nr:hypothetical protein DENSPDRAFT_845547 [Dentipellis sp. KUC8613]
MHQTACNNLAALEKLNDDVLSYIIHDFIFVKCDFDDGIAQLSLTSKRLRTACLPILFRKAKIKCHDLVSSAPPPASWPYVRTMEITGTIVSHIGFNSTHLRKILPHLVALRKIRFSHFTDGVDWYTLNVMLAAPNIRALEIEEPPSMVRNDLSFPDEINPAMLPFTEFIYTIYSPRSPWFYFKAPETIARRCYMRPLILALHEKLEVLHLPSAMAPLQQMADLHWPCLREFKLDRENYEGEDPTLFACLFSKMPQLRNLDLHFFHKGPSRQTLILPSDAPFSPSFDHLDSLYIPYPDPNDKLYDRIPLLLQRLRLVDRPRYYRFNTESAELVDGYTRPLLVTATELLHILKRLGGPFAILEHLELAFQADSQDCMLLAQTAEAFPNVRLLELHRYRSEGEAGIQIESAMENIATTLSTLRHLRHFRVYLNLLGDDYQPPGVHRQESNTESISESEFMALLRHHAMKIARNCSPSLRIIDFLTTYVYGEQFWIRCYVSRDDQGNPVLEFDEHIIVPPSRLFVFWPPLCMTIADRFLNRDDYP